MIRFLIIIILLFILYKIYTKKNYENMIGSLVYPNYVPNVNMTYYIDNIPFDIDYMCKNKNTKRYLGWPCWWRKYASNYCVKYPNVSTPFANYLHNTPLKFDGIWDKTCGPNQDNCEWKLEKQNPPVCQNNFNTRGLLKNKNIPVIPSNPNNKNQR